MQSELKPCPFCGKNVATIWNPANRLWTVECYDGDGGCMAGVFATSQNKATTAWNRRADA